jgi:hypothetical protein
MPSWGSVSRNNGIVPRIWAGQHRNLGVIIISKGKRYFIIERVPTGTRVHGTTDVVQIGAFF